MRRRDAASRRWREVELARLPSQALRKGSRFPAALVAETSLATSRRHSARRRRRRRRRRSIARKPACDGLRRRTTTHTRSDTDCTVRCRRRGEAAASGAAWTPAAARLVGAHRSRGSGAGGAESSLERSRERGGQLGGAAAAAATPRGKLAVGGAAAALAPTSAANLRRTALHRSRVARESRPTPPPRRRRRYSRGRGNRRSPPLTSSERHRRGGDARDSVGARRLLANSPQFDAAASTRRRRRRVHARSRGSATPPRTGTLHRAPTHVHAQCGGGAVADSAAVVQRAGRVFPRAAPRARRSLHTYLGRFRRRSRQVAGPAASGAEATGSVRRRSRVPPPRLLSLSLPPSQRSRAVAVWGGSGGGRGGGRASAGATFPDTRGRDCPPVKRRAGLAAVRRRERRGRFTPSRRSRRTAAARFSRLRRHVSPPLTWRPKGPSRVCGESPFSAAVAGRPRSVRGFAGCRGKPRGGELAGAARKARGGRGERVVARPGRLPQFLELLDTAAERGSAEHRLPNAAEGTCVGGGRRGRRGGRRV